MFTINALAPFTGLNYGDQTITDGIEVSVRLDFADSLALAFHNSEQAEGSDHFGAFRAYSHSFQDEYGKVCVKITFRCYADFTMAFAAGEIKHDNDFGRQRAFSSEHGITIRLQQLHNIHKLMANYQHKVWWTRPHFDPDLSRLPDRTQSLLWQTDALYYQLLPVCGPVYRTDLSGSEDGLNVRVSSEQGGHNRCDAFMFILGADEDPFKLVQRNVDKALRQLDYPTFPREQKMYPEIMEYLGWCSWDAFYHKVNEVDLLTKAAELSHMGLPVQWVMIDDGWSDIVDQKLNAFEADPVKFPRGLAHPVETLKQQFGIRWVGVWHTIVGYWGGIHPDSVIAKQEREHLFQTNKGNLIPYPEAGRGFGFWQAWHSFLRRQGVDFVKVDSQSAVNNYLKYQRSVGESAAAAHQALEASVALHFDETIINCMGMAAENIWHRPKSAISRNSDDFVPQDPDGFKEHALQNAYNSYYHGPFYWGDWDMFWTKNHDDVQNAVLRSISGGPIYFSDAIGKTDPAKVWPLIYQDGRIIRCSLTANPTKDCLMLDPTKEPAPLKLWNKSNGTGVLAAFHINKGSEFIDGSVGLGDVPDLDADKYVLFEHFSKQCLVMDAKARQAFRLKDGACALYLLIPIRGAVTPVGLINKYISADAIVKQWAAGESTFVQLREGGSFAFVSELQGFSVRINGETAQISSQNGALYVVDCKSRGNEVTIEIVHA